MHFADHGIAGHIAELRRDLAGRKSGLPELFQLLDAIIGATGARSIGEAFTSLTGGDEEGGEG